MADRPRLVDLARAYEATHGATSEARRRERLTASQDLWDAVMSARKAYGALCREAASEDGKASAAILRADREAREDERSIVLEEVEQWLDRHVNDRIAEYRVPGDPDSYSEYRDGVSDGVEALERAFRERFMGDDDDHA